MTWRDPWPTTAPGGTRYGPADDEHPGADRDWRLVLVPRDRLVEEVARAGGRRLAARRHLGQRGRPRRGVAAAGVPRGRPPHHPARARLAAHRGPPDTRAATAGRRPSRACTTSAARRGGSCMLHLDGSGHLLPEAGRRGARRGPDADAQEPGRVVGQRDDGRAPPRARPGRAGRGQAVGAGGRRAGRRQSEAGRSRPARRRSCRATASRWTGPPPADPWPAAWGSTRACDGGGRSTSAQAHRRVWSWSSRSRVRQGWARVRAAWFPILQASLAAAIAFAIARYAVGHPYPFFAPVSAWVALGFTADRSVRRVAELAVGVAIGVALGDLLVHLIGNGAVAGGRRAVPRGDRSRGSSTAGRCSPRRRACRRSSSSGCPAIVRDRWAARAVDRRRDRGRGRARASRC